MHISFSEFSAIIASLFLSLSAKHILRLTPTKNYLDAREQPLTHYPAFVPSICALHLCPAFRSCDSVWPHKAMKWKYCRSDVYI